MKFRSPNPACSRDAVASAGRTRAQQAVHAHSKRAAFAPHIRCNYVSSRYCTQWLGLMVTIAPCTRSRAPSWVTTRAVVSTVYNRKCKRLVQRHNTSQTPEHCDLLDRMQSVLDAWLKTAAQRKPVPTIPESDAVLPANAVINAIITISDSDDSDGPISRRARAAAVQYARDHAHNTAPPRKYIDDSTPTPSPTRAGVAPHIQLNQQTQQRGLPHAHGVYDSRPEQPIPSNPAPSPIQARVAPTTQHNPVPIQSTPVPATPSRGNVAPANNPLNPGSIQERGCRVYRCQYAELSALFNSLFAYLAHADTALDSGPPVSSARLSCLQRQHEPIQGVHQQFGLQDGNLWNAVPKSYGQYLDMTAQHPTDDEEDVSSTDDSQELTPGFVSDADDAIDGDTLGGDAVVMEYMRTMLPMTTRRLTEVRKKRCQSSNYTTATSPSAQSAPSPPSPSQSPSKPV